MHIRQDSGLLFDQVVANCPASADGVLIVGTGLRCVGIIDELESRLSLPVVTANQASLWRCLGLAGVDAPVVGYGRLLAGPGDLR
jgi:maleate isomerase